MCGEDRLVQSFKDTHLLLVSSLIWTMSQGLNCFSSPMELMTCMAIVPVCGSPCDLQAIHEVAMGDMDIRTVLQLEQFKNHVDHISGNKSKATLIGEFADCIAADTLTWEKFLFYYRALATSTMGNDISFTQSVRSNF